MMPDSTGANFRMVLFDPADGSVINSNYFPLNGATNSTPVHAIQVGSEVWVSEQVGDRIARYDLVGAYLGQVGGGTSGGLDNIRGMARVGNTVYVSNGGTANGAPSGNSVVMFDTAGAAQGSFSTAALAPSPFSVLSHQGGLLVGASGSPDDIHRFSLAGSPLGTFHNSTLAFVEQLEHATNGDVLAAVFTSGVVARLDPTTGALISQFTAAGARGVHQLGNGNIMWTSSGGVFVHNVATGGSTNIYTTTGGRYIGVLTISAQGACCNGVVCSVTTSTGCQGTFQGSASTCQAAGNPITCCPANFDHENGLQVQDIFAFLAAWFAGEPRADFDGANSITVADIFAFLGAWFAGCS